MYEKFLTLPICLICCSLLKAQEPADSLERLADSITISEHSFAAGKLPKPLKVVDAAGIATFSWVQASVACHARAPQHTLDDCRATVTPKGDYLLMFPDGAHYPGSSTKANDMVAWRSTDKGKTWTGPTIAFDIDYNQHGFIPFIPKNSKRIYAFGTQPIFGLYSRENGQQENAPIGFRYSDDDGYHWSEVQLIKPVNDPGFLGMSVMRMAETDKGTWILGSHESDWSYKPLITRQYVLRSEDQGKTWELLPNKRHGGWAEQCFSRMDEGQPVNLGNDSVMFLLRTPEGHLWSTYSKDDGKTWTKPAPTPLVHPDAPAMLYKLSDNKTLIAFIHNQNHDLNYNGLNGSKKEIMMDRAELWFSLSKDDGKTWSEPRFLFVNALAPVYKSPFRNYQCSYIDMFIDNGEINIFIPHRWERVVYVHFKESDLGKFPTKTQLLKTK